MKGIVNIVKNAIWFRHCKLEILGHYGEIVFLQVNSMIIIVEVIKIVKLMCI